MKRKIFYMALLCFVLAGCSKQGVSQKAVTSKGIEDNKECETVIEMETEAEPLKIEKYKIDKQASNYAELERIIEAIKENS